MVGGGDDDADVFWPGLGMRDLDIEEAVSYTHLTLPTSDLV